MTQKEQQEIIDRAHQKYGTIVANKERTYNDTLGEAYIQGATDQDPISRADEREKAIKWLENNMSIIRHNVHGVTCWFVATDKEFTSFESFLQEFKQATEVYL